MVTQFVFELKKYKNTETLRRIQWFMNALEVFMNTIFPDARFHLTQEEVIKRKDIDKRK